MYFFKKSVGRLLGSFIIGIVSDRFGRMKAITLSVLVLCLAGILETVVNNTIALGILRVLYGMGGNGCVIVTFVLAAESTLPRHAALLTTIPGIHEHEEG